jgi:hypothetical protein
MPNQSAPSWRELAAKAGREQDPEKLIELTRELIRAFDSQKLRKQKPPQHDK